MIEPQREQLIESPPDALKAIKELFKGDAAFYCERLKEGDREWRIVIFDEGKGYANDSAGQPSEIINREHLGRVLAARDAVTQEETTV